MQPGHSTEGPNDRSRTGALPCSIRFRRCKALRRFPRRAGVRIVLPDNPMTVVALQRLGAKTLRLVARVGRRGRARASVRERIELGARPVEDVVIQGATAVAVLPEGPVGPTGRKRGARRAVVGDPKWIRPEARVAPEKGRKRIDDRFAPRPGLDEAGPFPALWLRSPSR